MSLPLSTLGTSSSSLASMTEMAESSPSSATAGTLGVGVGVGLASFSSSNTPFSTLTGTASASPTLSPVTAAQIPAQLILNTSSNNGGGGTAGGVNSTGFRAQSSLNTYLHATTSPHSRHLTFSPAAASNSVGYGVSAAPTFSYLNAATNFAPQMQTSAPANFLINNFATPAIDNSATSPTTVRFKMKKNPLTGVKSLTKAFLGGNVPVFGGVFLISLYTQVCFKQKCTPDKVQHF